MQASERPLGQRLLTGFIRFIGTLFVIALIGLVAYLASERNARTFSLAQVGDQLVVMKGRMLPTGAEPWQPDDPGLVQTYAPIPLYGVTLDEGTLEQTFDDRDELDRALFRILESQARPRIHSDDPEKIERGVYYMRRAEKLGGITQDQRATLDALQSDVALYLARIKLDQARELLAEALGQLKVAATGQNRNADKANRLASEIAGPAQQFEEAVSRVLGGLPLASPKTEPKPPPADGQQTPAAPDAGTAAPSEVIRTDSMEMERPDAGAPLSP